MMNKEVNMKAKKVARRPSNIARAKSLAQADMGQFFARYNLRNDFQKDLEVRLACLPNSRHGLNHWESKAYEAEAEKVYNQLHQEALANPEYAQEFKDWQYAMKIMGIIHRYEYMHGRERRVESWEGVSLVPMAWR
jgi:hypothetical protein